MQVFEQQIQQLREGKYETVKDFMIAILKYTPAQAEEVIRNAKRLLGRLPEQQRNRKEEWEDEPLDCKM